MTIFARCLAFTLVVFASLPAMADDDDAPYKDTVFGDWGGLRTDWKEHGVDVNAVYTGQLWSNVSGGAKRGSVYDDNTELTADIDGEKAFGSPGTHIFLYVLNNDGGHPNSDAGTVQGVDNLEVGVPTAKLYEAWVEQAFLDGKLKALVGLRDLNAEFYVTEPAANFMHPAFGEGQEIAQTGRNGPSVFPYTAPALRLKYLPTEDSYINVAAFNAVAGDPDHPHGTHIEGFSDGALLVGEAGYTPGATDDSVPNKLAIGVWSYTHDMPDLAGTGGEKQWGVYGLASHECYKDDDGRKVTPFLRVGYAGSDTVQTDVSFQLGVAAAGWVPGRKEGEFGLGVSQARNSNPFMDVTAGADRVETAYEFYYRDHIMPGVSLQPDVQYVVNPGTDPTLDNATVLGLRMEVAF